MKINLEKQGDSIKINLQKDNETIKEIKIKLSWNKGVDLDLHAIYKTKIGKTKTIYFSNKGRLDKEPFIRLDKDSGVGNKSGDNEENITISKLDNFESVLFVVNIFRFLSKDESFSKYDGKVTIATNLGDEYIVPLTSTELGKWAVIAKLENKTEPKIININKIVKDEPKISDYDNFETTTINTRIDNNNHIPLQPSTSLIDNNITGQKIIFIHQKLNFFKKCVQVYWFNPKSFLLKRFEFDGKTIILERMNGKVNNLEIGKFKPSFGKDNLGRREYKVVLEDKTKIRFKEIWWMFKEEEWDKITEIIGAKETGLSKFLNAFNKIAGN